MNWKNQLEKYALTKDWFNLVEFIKKIIHDYSKDVEVYIRSIYVLHNTLVEENYDDSLHDMMAHLLLKCYNDSKNKYSDNPEYLFFIGNILYIADWYFNINDDSKPIEEKTAFKMQKKAFEQEPNNILFEWAWRNSMFDLSAPKLAAKILGNKNIINWLKVKGFPGKYVLNSILVSKERIV